MTSLDWGKFETLPGAAHRNWEVLCREVIRRHYERYGPLRTRKNQPGVEFHLTVERDGSSLGEPDRHWGWQCRWYERNSFRTDGTLTAIQRRKIEEAIVKSAQNVPGLTDWVLWTREKLSADDARWFDQLETPFTLHRYDEETLIGLLSSEAEPLRETWFGELTFDHERLGGAHHEALAPIRERYAEELHIRTPPETRVRELLPGGDLLTEVDKLQNAIGVAIRELRGQWVEDRDIDGEVSWLVLQSEATLAELRRTIEGGDLPSAGQLAAIEPRRSRPWLDRDRGGFAEVAGPALRDTLSFLRHLDAGLKTSMVAVVGGAGSGKTHLAADLASPHRNCGVLVLGRQFGTEIADDDLAVKSGLTTSRDELLEAMEAMGAREGRRIPLVIDGLNEARDPSAWKVVLARLDARLAELPHVLAVVTLRPSYVKRCLPPGVLRIEVTGFEAVEDRAASRYFDYYRIAANPEEITSWLPSDPLMLSLFCRSVNPAREQVVGPERLPSALHEVCNLYFQGIAERTAVKMGVDATSVQAAIDSLAHRFFAEGERELDRATVSEILEDTHWAEWDKTLRFNLEAEGLLLRDSRDDGETILWSYDLVAGHLIARTILNRHSNHSDLSRGELGAAINRHPLREDIVAGLCGLLAAKAIDPVKAMRFSDNLRLEAALASVRLASSEVSESAVDAIVEAFEASPAETLDAISPIALQVGHPLNARILDLLLGELEVWDRDLRWSEWVRSRSETISRRINELTQAVEDKTFSIDPRDALVWLTWLLTSTDKRLRDEAIHALYELGRSCPQDLFSRAVSMLALNDPWVAQGLLAASYGVAMASQDPGQKPRPNVEALATNLAEQLLNKDAWQPTYDWLLREYAFRINQLAHWLSGDTFNAPSDASQPAFPQPPGGVGRFEIDSDEWQAIDPALDMDFSNYTIGSIVEGRDNYDLSHTGFVAVMGEIRARVAELGWTDERFGDIDEAIGAANFERDNSPNKVERYGKKYSWIGFYEAAGRLSDRGELSHAFNGNHRLADVQIDPSFPRDPSLLPFELPAWATSESSDEAWVRTGAIKVPHHLLWNEMLGERMAWVALDGYLQHDPDGTDRRAFCSVRGVLALDRWSSIERFAARNRIGYDTVARNAADHYCFSGEAPWAPTFDCIATEADGTVNPHIIRLGHPATGPRVELMAVDFNWESYHSAVNNTRVGSLPAKGLARSLGLRKRVGLPEFIDPEGRLAAVGLAVTQGDWDGRILYLREDLLHTYLRTRGGDWGWVLWGERQIKIGDRLPDQVPRWLKEAITADEEKFGRILAFDDLAVPHQWGAHERREIDLGRLDQTAPRSANAE